MQKFFVYLLYNIGSHMRRAIAIAVSVIAILFVTSSTTWYSTGWSMVRDGHVNRGAVTLPADKFGDRALSKVVYLPQNWDETDSLWFYNVTQGSDLLPYDFFIYLEQAGSQELFRSPENMNYFRYLPQAKTEEDPDALPLGMVEDTFQGKKYMGFTCAACHTSQVNHNGVGIRIDGGPGAADMDGFMNAMEQALIATRNNPQKLQRFTTAVLNAGNYRDADSVKDDLDTYILRLKAYNYFDASYVTNSNGERTPVPYGYSRLDAFGRIYNRVLEHLMNPDSLKIVLKGVLDPGKAEALVKKLEPVLTDDNRDTVMKELMSQLSQTELDKLRERTFNSPNAPVSYPFVWDIPQHDYVQWNGIGVNAGAGPLGRNTGEVIGVFATLDWEAKDRWYPVALTGWLGIGPKNIIFKSSVNGHHLRQIEDRLWKLWSPQWQDGVKMGVLPDIDSKKAGRGEVLFDDKCANCHATIDSRDPTRRIVAHLDKGAEAKTDLTMASNSVKYQGYSGILRNEYVDAGSIGSILLNTKAPVAALLTKATQNVVATPSPDKWFLTRGADWLVDLLRGIFSNKIKPSLKSGNYIPDTTGSPYDSLVAYKARALNGIWATAPYLHNGSVPTLYDLLLPADPEPGDPPGMQYRPKTFMVGSRELDVEKVGFRHDGSAPMFEFNTSLPSNSNKGHEYCTRELSDDDRWALVEYMKTL